MTASPAQKRLIAAVADAVAAAGAPIYSFEAMRVGGLRRSAPTLTFAICMDHGWLVRHTAAGVGSSPGYSVSAAGYRVIGRDVPPGVES